MTQHPLCDMPEMPTRTPEFLGKNALCAKKNAKKMNFALAKALYIVYTSATRYKRSNHMAG